MKSKNLENILNDDSLIEEDLRRARWRVNYSTRNKLSEEIILKHKCKVRELAETILTLNSVRHSWVWKDVDFLNNLELDYLMKWHKGNYNLAQNITINEEYISVAWMQIRRFDEQDELNKEAWIFKSIDWKQTFYKLKTIKRKATSLWLNILSLNQLQQIVSLMPWSTKEEQAYNFVNIFNIELAWHFLYYCDSVRGSWEFSSYWIIATTGSRLFSLWITKDKIWPAKKTLMNDALSLRCVRK